MYNELYNLYLGHFVLVLHLFQSLYEVTSTLTIASNVSVYLYTLSMILLYTTNIILLLEYLMVNSWCC